MSSETRSREGVGTMADQDDEVSDSSVDTVEVDHFATVKDTNWSKSVLITSGKFFTIAKCDKQHKLSFLCTLCPKQPAIFISADPSSSANLRSHISVSCYLLLNLRNFNVFV